MLYMASIQTYDEDEEERKKTEVKDSDDIF